MVLSVIIVSYNSSSFLELCLYSVQKSLSKTDIKSEIIVVDNSSSDDSCNIIKNKYPSVLLVENQTNKGFSKANNIGVSKSSGKYICILNPDTVLSEDTFAKILRFYESAINVGFVGCHMIDGTGVFLKESKRTVPSFFSSFMKIIGLSKFYYSSLNNEQSGCVDVLAGAFMFTEKTIYDKIDGFDEEYFMYGEDIDLCYKALKNGYSNYFLGDVKIIHFKGESTDKNFTYVNRFYNAMYIFYKKHFNNFLISRSVVWILIKFLIYIKRFYIIILTKFNSQDCEVEYENKFLITNSLSNKFDFNSTVININQLTNKKIKNSLILFDLNTILLSDIIFQYEHLSKTNNFRIIVPNTNFYIGSDFKDKKGQIVHFNVK